ncbi:ABC transporter permease subunit [Isosphaeraceae bacterium EP7]
MLPGPVFAMELLTTARRRRYYVFRTVYATAILGFMLMWFGQYRRMMDGAEMSFQEIAAVGLATFGMVAYVEIITVLGLTPVLVAGVIADETQRKTLHFVLATPLPSSEIVLGKMLARLLHIFIFIAIIVPILAILSLAGGVDPWLEMALIVGSAATGFFLASISLLASTLARRVRDAVLISYAIEAIWLLGSACVAWLMWMISDFAWPPLLVALGIVSEALWAINPSAVFSRFGDLYQGKSSAFFGALWLMVGLQLALGLVFTTLAVFQLRPAFRRRESQSPVENGRWRLPIPARFRRARAVGNWPMVWKERHAHTRGVARLLVLLLGVMMLAFTGITVFNLAAVVFQQWSQNPPPGPQMFGPDFALTMGIRAFATAWGAILMLSVASAASSSITSEKEGDTWLSLIATDLSSREILAGKAAGALAGAWIPALVLVLLVAIGSGFGTLHPLGVILFTLLILVYAAFSASLGLFLSLKSRTTWRAQAFAVGIMLMLSIGIFCCSPLIMATAWMLAASPLVAMGGSLFSSSELPTLFDAFDGMGFVAGFVGWAGYGVAAYLLWVSSVRTLEEERGDLGPSDHARRMRMLKPADEDGIEFIP